MGSAWRVPAPWRDLNLGSASPCDHSVTSGRPLSTLAPMALHPELLDRQALNRATLARQLLLERDSSMTTVDALEHLGEAG